MTDHDNNFTKINQEFMKKINPKFQKLTFDLQEVMELSSNPAFIGAMLFKIAEERKKSNELLEKINSKYDKIMLSLKNSQKMEEKPRELKLLPEQDVHIINMAQDKGSVTAGEVQKALGYKGKNAASQRLNKLCKEGYLKKTQVGKKVIFYN